MAFPQYACSVLRVCLNVDVTEISVARSRFRGNSLGLPSISRYRMPSGMNVSRVIDNLSESDMDTSDSEGERYGACYSLEASPQDDKVPSRGTKHNSITNAYSSDATSQGNYLERLGGRVGGFSTAHCVYDESSDSVNSLEVNSTLPWRNNGVLKNDFNPEANLPGTNRNYMKHASHDDDIPSAPRANNL